MVGRTFDGEILNNVPESWLQRVRFTAAEPTSWLSHARTLRQAAEDLWVAGNEHDRNPGSEIGAQVLSAWTAPGFVRPETGGSTCDVCFMLFGFALENLAKGIIVCRDPGVVTRTRIATWHGEGHNLVTLFDRAAVPYDDAEGAALERITRITTWKARYPVAMKFYDVGPQDPIIGHIAVSNVWPGEEMTRLRGLHDRAKAILIETMRITPPLPFDYDFG